MDFLKWMLSDLLHDGYSVYFGIAFLFSIILLVRDIRKHGWMLEEDEE